MGQMIIIVDIGDMMVSIDRHMMNAEALPDRETKEALIAASINWFINGNTDVFKHSISSLLEPYTDREPVIASVWDTLTRNIVTTLNGCAPFAELVAVPLEQHIALEWKEGNALFIHVYPKPVQELGQFTVHEIDIDDSDYYPPRHRNIIGVP